MQEIQHSINALHALLSLRSVTFTEYSVSSQQSPHRIFSRTADSSADYSSGTRLQLPHSCYACMLPPYDSAAQHVILKSAFQNLRHFEFSYQVQFDRDSRIHQDVSAADQVVETGQLLAHGSGLHALTHLSVEYSLVRDGLFPEENTSQEKVDNGQFF